MRFGLRDNDLAHIIRMIETFHEIEKVVIFGSRAKGNHKPGSDIDIAILGDKVNFNTVASLHGILEEEGPLPYFFDIVDYTHLDHQGLKEHIDRIGQVIYVQES